MKRTLTSRMVFSGLLLLALVLVAGVVFAASPSAPGSQLQRPVTEAPSLVAIEGTALAIVDGVVTVDVIGAGFGGEQVVLLSIVDEAGAPGGDVSPATSPVGFGETNSSGAFEATVEAELEEGVYTLRARAIGGFTATTPLRVVGEK
ncbi:MAG: hypothetical protein ACE5IG_06655 [Dehalococcoidia bacterium]